MSVTKSSVSERSAVFKTPWFELIGKKIDNDDAPHYSISTQDYVSVFAVTKDGKFPLVRQFRPAIEEITLELPSGHVDEGETPEQAAARELREETGFIVNKLFLVGNLSPDTGRLSNRMWCFFAPDVTPSQDGFMPHPEVEPVVYDKSLGDLLLNEPTFPSALNRATILMAVAQGHIEL